MADLSRNMLFEENRLKTFSRWVYKNKKDVKCTAEKMAKAGFFQVSCNENDVAKCFVCFKQLDGWEADDDPFEEHKKHAAYCPFVKLGKEEVDMTIKDMLQLSKEMEINLICENRNELLKQLDNGKSETIRNLKRAKVNKNR